MLYCEEQNFGYKKERVAEATLPIERDARF
jgi:hypothetical protein